MSLAVSVAVIWLCQPLREVVRYLIVNADDFGLCDEVNAGVVTAHDRGIVTSASLMVRWGAAAAAVEQAADRPRLSLGLHVDLGEWEATADGGWVERYSVVDTNDEGAVSAEVERQVSEFERLAGRPPTHLDGHQHIHRTDPARRVLHRLALELAVPLRFGEPGVTYRGEFYGQGPRGEPFPDGVSVANLVALISTLTEGWHELGCHPGIRVAASTTSYAAERTAEVSALCHPDVRTALERHGVALASFADLTQQQSSR